MHGALDRGARRTRYEKRNVLTREKILDAWKARWERTLDEKFLSWRPGNF